MICRNCQKEISRNVKYCKHCGKEAVKSNQAEEGSVDLYFDRKENSCQLCGAYAPVKYVEFHQNIGMLITREYKYIKGKLCKNCINKTFRSFTFTTLAIGWFGVISLVVAPIFIINNIYYYISSLGLKDSK